ncbi:hypothetical protein WMY93_001514 [Mugilogobius chulae]|uniref:Actinodin3 n=1 Tax=Mugilogobius chulae TaxID=88201 RepID=A0AAW0Q2G9_9GOBI
MAKMRAQESLMRVLGCLLLIPALLSATPLMKIKKSADSSLSIGSSQAHDFLRPKRNVDPRWYRADPNFQSYYRYYSNIGHYEGIYQIDKLRMLYQQMRYLEHTYGPDASSYQNVLGVMTTTAAPTTTTQPPPPPTTAAPTPDPLASAQKIYLCNPKDPLCKPQIVYLPTGAVPVLCDPRSNPACRPKTEEEIKAAAPVEKPAPPAPKKSDPPPPPPPPLLLPSKVWSMTVIHTGILTASSTTLHVLL